MIAGKSSRTMVWYIVIIIGIKSGGHDPSIAILKDGELVFAAEEERFTRKKHAHGQIPINALKSGLKSIDLPAELVDYTQRNQLS